MITNSNTKYFSFYETCVGIKLFLYKLFSVSKELQCGNPVFGVEKLDF